MIFWDVFLILAVVIMSVIAVIVTAFDKKASRVGTWNRVSEKALITIAFFFGSFAMYITMRMIHHKTLHALFMVGIPIIMLLHIAFFALYIFLLRPMIA